MFSFIIRPLLQIIPLLLVIMTMTFFIMRLAPGNPFANERQLSEVVQRNVNRRFRLDRPMFYITFDPPSDEELAAEGEFGRAWSWVSAMRTMHWNGLNNQYHNYFFWHDVEDEET